MTVASILRNKGDTVVSVRPGDRLGEVARTLVHHRIGAALVCEHGCPPVGIISERDVTRVFAREEGMAERLTAADAMTQILYTITPETTIERALEMMTDRRVRHLPVLEDGRLRGIVSIGDLVKARIEDALGEAAALRDYVAAG